VSPTRHVAPIAGIEMTGASEPAQHPSTHLPLHRGEVFGCQRSGLTELDLLALPNSKHPVGSPAGASPPVRTSR